MIISNVTVVRKIQYLEQDGNAQNVTILTSALHVIMETNIWSTGFGALMSQEERGKECN